MFLPSQLISTVACGQAKYPSLYLSAAERYTLKWLVEADQKKYAVSLYGNSAGSGIEIIEQTGDYGVQIYPVSVRVNPAAAAPMGIGWNLQAVDNALMLGFPCQNHHVWAPVADLTNTVKLDQQGLYFREWSAGIEVGGEWIELVTATGHDFTTNPELTAVVP
jgi:hypothetical protein